MRIFLTGATGFVGRALAARLLGEGIEVTAEVRSPRSAAGRLGPEVELVDAADEGAILEALGRSDAVVNLAGENLFGGRWTAERKRRLVESRVDRTRRLVALLGRASHRPQLLVSASAIGIYGDVEGEPATEGTPAAADFLGGLCRDWEAAALEARTAETRVAIVRIGLVLGAGGGALERLVPMFELGLGGRLGDGRQPVSWIHVDDLVGIFVAALRDPRIDAPVNAVAPEVVTNGTFTDLLAGLLGRPALLPVPAPLLRLVLGEASRVLLGGRTVLPRRLDELGWSFRFPSLREALADVVRPAMAIGPVPAGESAGEGLAAPVHLLETQCVVDAPLERVFEFFSRPANLGVLTPASMAFECEGPPPLSTREGQIIDYRLRVGPFPLRWRTLISSFEPGRRFVDLQLRGPYRLWHHEHRFEAVGPDRTRMTDRVLFTIPGGPIGRLALPLVVAPALRRIFGYRAATIRRRFPDGARSVS
jgi:uncharacterized protein (TIGR01777 family)